MSCKISRIIIYYFKIVSLLLRKRYVQHTYCGFPLWVLIGNEVSLNWYDHDCYRKEISFLKNHTNSHSSIIFDLGSHHSVIALIFSNLVGRQGKVISVEMDPIHCWYARRNIEKNNATNVKIIQAAVGSNNSKNCYFNNDVIISQNETAHNSAQLITIDSLSKKYGYPHVLYIDVEGYEEKVLEGARKTLTKYPTCCIEVHINEGLEKFGGSVQKIISYFPQKIYKLYMSEATDDCKVIKFNKNNIICKNRFYLYAIKKN